MEIVASYPNVLSLKKNLVDNYSFKERSYHTGNCIEFPEDIGHGTITLFERHGMHFMRGNWNCKKNTSFNSRDSVGKEDLIDFRIGKTGEVRSAYLEGCDRYEWDITQVDGMRIMIPSSIFNTDKPSMLDTFQKYVFEMNIKTLISDLLSTSTDDFLNALRLEWKFLELSYNWIQFFNQKEIAQNFEEVPSLRRSAIEDAIDIIRSNVKTPPDIIELSKRVGLNQQYLKSGFRKSVGVTIHQYLINERMKIAKELVRNNSLCIKDISHEVGYEDAGHFSKLYKKFYGTTPLQHRNQLSDTHHNSWF